jgi:hypothetical protein
LLIASFTSDCSVGSCRRAYTLFIHRIENLETERYKHQRSKIKLADHVGRGEGCQKLVPTTVSNLPLPGVIE